VAELVISPYYSMRESVALLQDKLRAQYPRTLEAQQIVLDSAKPEALPLWRLFSSDGTRGVQLGTHTISFHATSYVDSSDFLGKWAEVLDAVAGARLSPFVERAGLRYIDLILPSEGSTVSDYLHPQLRGVTPDGGKLAASVWASGFRFDDSLVNLRVSVPAPRGMLLPIGFTALPLQKAAIMQMAEDRVAAQGEIGFIDTDCIRTLERPFDPAEIVSAFSEMHKLTSRTFNAVLSPAAKDEWK
jgi:uncharacterized protein (TIGR04255 family)